MRVSAPSAGGAPALEAQLAAFAARVAPHRVALRDATREDLLSERVLEVLLDCALEGPRAVGRVVAHVAEEVLRPIAELERDPDLGCAAALERGLSLPAALRYLQAVSRSVDQER